MNERSRTWRVTIHRRELFEIFVEAASADTAEEEALELWAGKQMHDPEPYERVIESVQAEETDH